MTGVALAAAAAAAVANVLGAAMIVARRRWSPGALRLLLSFAAGFMIAVGLGEMLPEALATGGSAAPWVALGGYAAVHLAQHTVVPHFHFGEESHALSRATGLSALGGLVLHLLVDGIAIASGFAVGTAAGTLVAVAVVMHKLPEGATIASVLLAAGYGRAHALAAAAVLGSAAIAGVLLTYAAAPVARHGLALSAGVVIYVAASNLVPEFQHERGWAVSAAFFGGVAAFAAAHALAALAGARV